VNKPLCEKCKNKIVYKVHFTNESRLMGSKCVYGIEERLEIVECTHFKEKPEDRKSKPLASARLSTSCEQPSNHGRIGKMPRKQPKSIRQAFESKGGD